MSEFLKLGAAAVLLAIAFFSYSHMQEDDESPAATSSAGDERTRPDAQQSKAPFGSPLSNSESSVAVAKDRSLENGLAAKFAESAKCYSTYGGMAELQGMITACEPSPDDTDGSQNEACAKNLDQYLADLKVAREESRTCPFNKDEAVTTYYEATKEAAKNGNPDAQVCYLNSAFNGKRYSERDIAEYKAAASGYVANAFARGDWRIVQLLSTTRFSEESGLLPLLANENLMTAFKMNRLLRQGATGRFAEDLDIFADGNFLSRERTGNQGLTPTQIVEATRWARSIHQRHFVASPPLSEAPKVCGG